jgi:hypothetical protein
VLKSILLANIQKLGEKNMKAKTLILIVAAVIALSLTYFTVEAMANRGHGALGEVYVSSQSLYFDTFVSAETLPPHGPFQLLVGGVTEFGPGDPGYLGGRWKVPNDEGGYDYFLCPLLPPGREEPRPPDPE